MTTRLITRSESMVRRVIIATIVCVGFFNHPSVAQTACPATPAGLAVIIQTEADPVVRSEAAECFVERATEFSYWELEEVVHKMLGDEEAAHVRRYGLFNLAASYLGGHSTGSDLWLSKTNIIRVLEEDPVVDNRAAAAELLAALDPIPEKQIENTLLDLLSHPDANMAATAFDTLMRFEFPPEPEIGTIVMRKMVHSKPRQRGMAARALGLLHRGDRTIDPAVVSALAVALRDTDNNVKIQAARSLERLGAQAASAAPDLAALVWDPKQPPYIRQVAQEAEEAITGQPTRPPWSLATPTPHYPANAGGSR